MVNNYVLIYTVFSLILAAADITIAHLARHFDSDMGRCMSMTTAFAALVNLCYLGSLLTRSEIIMSLMTNLYFIAIDWTLVFLIRTVLSLTRRNDSRIGQIITESTTAFSVFETVGFLINILFPITVDFIPFENVIGHFIFELKPLYFVHLTFTYAMVVITIFLLLQKMINSPSEYRIPYLLGILAILLIVVINAFFLYMPGDRFVDYIDTSMVGYSIASAVCYWGWFIYPKSRMFKSLSLRIFDNIGQGIVLYDYEDHIVMKNARASFLLGNDILDRNSIRPDLEKKCGIAICNDHRTDNCALQCYVDQNGKSSPLRCDYHCLRNGKGQTLGYLYTFTDASLETDLLTGFQSWKGFTRHLSLKNLPMLSPTSIAIFDINNLTFTNNTFGRTAGDKQIRALSEVLRQTFPSDSYFIRGFDAWLFVVSPGLSEREMTGLAEQAVKQSDIPVQSAVSCMLHSDEDVEETMKIAAASLENKKLMDKNSAHSQMLSSLVRALQESDSDTEAHVQRTRKLGAELGQRLNLSDIQQSQLSLLCLLHDIGKIGIPLEVLNKPGKLTESEWEVLKTHVNKGYQIAISSSKLEGIANLILHHHERWDGKGYPDGLSRESIPLLSRIIAIVDAYDAMTCDRVYRPAISPAKALAELKRCAGSQFDPGIVSEFVQMILEQGTVNEKELSDQTALTGEQPRRQTAYAMPAIKNISSDDLQKQAHPIAYCRYILDEDLKILEVNDVFEEITGYTREDIKNNDINQRDLIPAEDLNEYMLLVNAQLRKNDDSIAFIEHRLLTKYGDIRYVFCCGRQFFDPVIKAGRVEIIVFDNSTTYYFRLLREQENSRAQKQLMKWEQTYRRDALTELLNHTAFSNDIEGHLLNGSKSVMLLMMDVDHFKDYNDTFGHGEGDKLLVQIAQILKSSLRHDDMACRMGGDEFAVAIMFPADQSIDVLRSRAQQIFDTMNMHLSGINGNVSMSMGMAVSSAACHTFKMLYKEADDALYAAKRDGRARIHLV